MKAFIAWEVSSSFSGQQNIQQNCAKEVPLQLQQIVHLGSGRWDSRKGIGREEMRKYWGGKCVDGQGIQGFLQVTALSLLWRVRKRIYRALCWPFFFPWGINIFLVLLRSHSTASSKKKTGSVQWAGHEPQQASFLGRDCQQALVSNQEDMKGFWKFWWWFTAKHAFAVICQ